jgi:hypothetical protein
MSKIMAIVCGLFLFSTAASAQRFNAFVGYSHIGFGPNLYSLRLDPLSPPLRRSKNGWNASLEAKVLPVLGIVADFSGYYGNSTASLGCSQYVAFCGASNANFSLYAFTFGPQVSLPFGRFKPYAHALFGVSLSRPSLPSSTSFADLLGGGIDISLVPRLAWRAQADVTQTRFSVACCARLEQNSENSLRLSTGLVLRF